MAGDTSTKSGWQQSLATANRLRPVIVALLAVALVGVFPAHHKDTRNSSPKKADVATTGGPTAGAATAAKPGSENPAGSATAQTPTGGATAGAGLNRATTATTATKTGQAAATAKSGAATTATPTVAAPTGAGLNSAAAMAEPTCDPKTKRLKISFQRAAPCAVAWPKGADNGGATTG